MKAACALAMMETAMSLYHSTYQGPVRKHFQCWHSGAVRSRLAPIDRGDRHAETLLRRHVTYLKASDQQPGQPVDQHQDPMGEGPAQGLRNKQNFVQRDLLALLQPGSRPQNGKEHILGKSPQNSPTPFRKLPSSITVQHLQTIVESI
jgi:hypothetical protein